MNPKQSIISHGASSGSWEGGLRLPAAIPKPVSRFLAIYEDALASSRLTATQFVILNAIQAAKSRIQTIELARTLFVHPASLRRDLRTLERARFVQLAAHHKQRGGRWVELTAVGLAKLRQARPLWQRAQARADTLLGEPLAADLRGLLTLLTPPELAASLGIKTPYS